MIRFYCDHMFVNMQRCPIRDICNLKSLIFGFLKLFRDMGNCQWFYIGENNVKSLQP